MFWDVAAGIALVQAAGGKAVALDGGEPVPGSGSVVVGSARTVDAVVNAISSIGDPNR
jgi:fructose-1,6-bisphosphatase/inositol monophosphatase family enzyme